LTSATVDVAFPCEYAVKTIVISHPVWYNSGEANFGFRILIHELSDIMLFDRNIEPSCSYCRYGTFMGYDEVACVRRGIMSGAGYCGFFRYEPTKRVPPIIPRLNLSELSEEDFTL